MKQFMKKKNLLVKVILLLVVVGIVASLSAYYYFSSSYFQLRELIVLDKQALVSPTLNLTNAGLAILANHPRLGVQHSLAPLAKVVVSQVYQGLPANTIDDLVFAGERAEVLSALASGKVQAALISEPEPAELIVMNKQKLQMKLIAKNARVFLVNQQAKINNLSLRQAVNSERSNSWHYYQCLDGKEQANYRLLTVAGIAANKDNILRDVYPLVENIYFAFLDQENIYLTRLADFFLSVQGQNLLSDYHLVSLNH